MATPPDARLGGFAAASFAAAYLVAIFVPALLTTRVATRILAGGVSIAIAYLAMPPWRESVARKAFAARLMVVEAVLTAVIGSLVKRALW